jgi:Cof subfamily protein (haloacid dehalogenase superfamily)
MSIRLVALDLDGTLLDPYGKLSPGVVAAVASLRRAGPEVMLCTGRRYRTALPMAMQLGLEGPIVTNNGVLVKDIETGRTLQHAFFPTSLYADVLAEMRSFAPPLVYIDAYHECTDMVTERVEEAHAFQQEYLADNTAFLRLVADLDHARPDNVIMMSAMADTASLMELRKRAVARLGDRVHTHRLMNKSYQGDILEFLSPEAGKWAALARFAASIGIDPEEIAAVGDDHNDADMIAGAGMGIAMGNAVDAAKEGAEHIVSSNAEGGAIEAIEKIRRAL